MNTPVVSVVVATYNYGRFLPDAIASIQAQTFTDWEAIVVDDGSTDETPNLVKPFLKDPRFKYFQTEHLGQPAAKNFGINQSTGIFVAFLDADDCWCPSKLEKQLPLFSDPQVAVVYSLRYTMDETGCVLQRQQIAPKRGDVFRDMFKDNFVCFSSSIVRRLALQQAGGFDQSLPLAIDYDLWLRLARDWKFDYVEEPLVWYRTGHANLSRRGHERIQIVLGIMDRIINDPQYSQRLNPHWIARCYAETYFTLSQTLQPDARNTQRRWLLRSLRLYPSWRALKGLIKSFIPAKRR